MDPTTTPTAEPAAPAPAAPAPAANPYADLLEFMPAGADPAAYVRETLQVRHNIDRQPGGLEGIINARALDLAPQLAEELLRSPEGREIAEKIVGARAREQEGEPLSPEEQRLLQVADRAEAAEKRAERAEQLAQQGNSAIIQQRIVGEMEQELAAAMAQQPEAEDWADEIREWIGTEAYANPQLLEPGYVKRRALELYNRFSSKAPASAARTATRGRASGQAGGGTAVKKNPADLSREEADDLMAAIMAGEA